MCWRRKLRSRSSDVRTCCVAAIVLLLAWNASAADFAIIASPGTPAEGLSLDGLRRVFGLETRHWSGGRPIAVLLPGSGQIAREVMLRRILHLDDDQLRQLILGKIYRGE